MITGKTQVIAHLGYPTEAFKAPMIYNPWFDAKGVDAVVVPLGVKPEDYADVLRPLFKVTNLHGALVTMPHKVATTKLVDELTVTAKISGAANAILRRDGWFAARRHVRRGRLRARRRAQGQGHQGGQRAGRRLGRRRQRDRRLARPGGGREARPLRRVARRGRRRSANGSRPTIPRSKSRLGSARSRRLRHRRQRDAARHEAGRPAADRRRRRSRRRRSSARS